MKEVLFMKYIFNYTKMPNDDEYLDQSTTKINNNEFTYWVIKSQKDDSFLGISSDVDNILSMALSQQNQNQDLQKMNADLMASSAKASIDVENLKQMNANLMQQLAKSQIK